MASFDGLDRMKALLSALGNPEADFRAIHIAGTNGKGSTAVMTASILEEAGFTVGLYTSPHLEDECERVQIWDGTHRMIDQAYFDELKDRARSIEPNATVFEVYTAAAYLYFAEMQPDYVVLETGLGGNVLCDLVLFLAKDMADDLAAVFFIRFLELQSHILFIIVLCQRSEKGIHAVSRRSVLSQIFEQNRNCDHHEFFNFLLRKTGLFGDLCQ